MKFPAVEDIPDIETLACQYFSDLIPRPYDAVDAVRFALRHWNNFKVKPPAIEESDLIAMLRIRLELFAVTHQEQRVFFSGERTENPTRG